MQPTKMPTRSQCASRVITASLTITTTFVMHAMVGRRSTQLKMPRPDAYRELGALRERHAREPEGGPRSLRDELPPHY